MRVRVKHEKETTASPAEHVPQPRLPSPEVQQVQQQVQQVLQLLLLRVVRVRVEHERETAAKTCSSVSRRLLTTQWRGERAPLFSDAHGARARRVDLSSAACTSLLLQQFRVCGAC